MKIALGSDHGGFQLKEELKRRLAAAGHEVIDVGTGGTEPVDYPDFAAKVARLVAGGQAERGIMIDGAGVGSAMAAGKLAGIRAACVSEIYTARNARAHNDANVLTMGSMVIGPGVAAEIATVFLATAFEGGRHARRVEKIDRLLAPGGPGAIDEAGIRALVGAIVAELERAESGVESGRPPPVAAPAAATPAATSQPGAGPPRLLTETAVRDAARQGRTEIEVGPRTLVTPLARDTARDFGIRIRVR